MIDLTCPYCGSEVWAWARRSRQAAEADGYGSIDITCENRHCRAVWNSSGTAERPSRLPPDKMINRGGTDKSR